MNELRTYYIRYPLLAALLYSIPLTLFLFNTAYQNIWILYIGNILFCGMVLWSLIHFNIYYLFNIHPAANPESKLLEQSPSQAGHDASGELLSTLFTNTVVINAVLGCLVAGLGATVAKKNQRTEKGKTLY